MLIQMGGQQHGNKNNFHCGLKVVSLELRHIEIDTSSRVKKCFH